MMTSLSYFVCFFVICTLKLLNMVVDIYIENKMLY